jgi:hypothetical protein
MEEFNLLQSEQRNDRPIHSAGSPMGLADNPAFVLLFAAIKLHHSSHRYNRQHAANPFGAILCWLTLAYRQ